MAEIKQTRVSGYMNPMMPEKDEGREAIQKRQLAMQEAVAKYQIAGMKENQRMQGINRKANDWFASNSDSLFSQTSNPLDSNSLNFSDPEKISAMYKKYREEVGGNYDTFQEYIKMGQANEIKNNRRQLDIMIDEYDSPEKAKKAINKQLQGMSEGDRNKLFSMLDEESYSRLNEIYDTGSGGFFDTLMDNKGKVALGVGATAYAGYRLLKGRGGANVLDDIAKAGKKGGKKVKKSSKAIKQEVLQLGPGAKRLGPGAKQLRGMTNDPNTIYAGGKRVPLIGGKVGKGPKTSQDLAREAMEKQGKGVPRESKIKFDSKKIQDAEFEDIKVKSKQIIPDNKISAEMKMVGEKMRSGQITKLEAKSYREAIESLQRQGAPLTKGALVETLKSRPGGVRFLEKIANKEIGWKGTIGAGLAGAYIGGGIMSKGAEALGFGEKGQKVGEIVGTTGGAIGSPGAIKGLQQIVKQQGPKAIYDKLLKKKGAKWVATKVASGALKGLLGGSGIGTAVGVGLLALDAMEIYNILKED